MFLDDIPQSDLNTFNEFLKNNALWIALGFFALIIIALALVITFSLLNKHKESIVKGEINKKESLLTLLGGKENIVSANSRGSRVIVELKDYSLVNEEKLESAGVISFIKMSNKITLVVDKNADKVCAYLNKGIN